MFGMLTSERKLLDGNQLDADDSWASAEILMITGSCCIPWMAATEARVESYVRRIALAVGLAVSVRKISLSSLPHDGRFQQIRRQLIDTYNASGEIALPLIFINGALASYGTSELNRIESMLRRIKDEARKDGVDGIEDSA